MADVTFLTVRCTLSAAMDDTKRVLALSRFDRIKLRFFLRFAVAVRRFTSWRPVRDVKNSPVRQADGLGHASSADSNVRAAYTNRQTRAGAREVYGEAQRDL